MAKYEVEFYRDEYGHEPAKAFMQSLTPRKRRAIGVAINELLAPLGPDAVESGYAKALGDGLYEFRLDQDAEQVLRRVGKTPKPEPSAEAKVLLRVFFHVHGNKVILLLSGYDKSARTSRTHQNAEIEKARALLRAWRVARKRLP